VLVRYLFVRLGEFFFGLRARARIAASVVIGAGACRSRLHTAAGDAEEGSRPAGLGAYRARSRTIFFSGGELSIGSLYTQRTGDRPTMAPLAWRPITAACERTGLLGEAPTLVRPRHPLTTPNWNPLQHPPMTATAPNGTTPFR